MKIAINDGENTYILKIGNRSPATIIDLIHKLNGAFIGLNSKFTINCRYDFEKDEDTHKTIMQHRKRAVHLLPKPPKEHFFDSIIYGNTDSIRNDPD